MADSVERFRKLIGIMQQDVADFEQKYQDCASHGCGCCGMGDIRFNVVGESGWAERAEVRKAQSKYRNLT